MDKKIVKLLILDKLKKINIDSRKIFNVITLLKKYLVREKYS